MCNTGHSRSLDAAQVAYLLSLREFKAKIKLSVVVLRELSD
jgi:hypothetical protein